jgi:TonB family protein
MFARIPVASIAMVGSVAVHATVFFGMPGDPEAAGARPASLAEIEVAVASMEDPSAVAEQRDAPPLGAGAADVADANEATARPLAGPVARSHARARSIPVAPDRGTPSAQAAPGTKGTASSLPPSPPEGAASSTPLRFAITLGPTTLAPVASTASAPLGPAASGAASSGTSVRHSGDTNDSHGDAVFGEDGVDARPRLLAWQAPHYPPSAASAGVEVDVPVDVVIDTVGLVTDVRLPKHFGYGLDEAAIATARSYRFTRGLKDGRAVRVRMRCTVMFRLN